MLCKIYLYKDELCEILTRREIGPTRAGSPSSGNLRNLHECPLKAQSVVTQDCKEPGKCQGGPHRLPLVTVLLGSPLETVNRYETAAKVLGAML